MIPNKLKRYFGTNHGTLINVTRDCFVRQREQIEQPKPFKLLIK